MAETPLEGDRAAFAVISHPTKHADDLKSGTPIHHVPAGVYVGDAPVWDGTKYAPTNVGVVPPIITLGTKEGNLSVSTDPFKFYNLYGTSRIITKVFLSVSTAPTVTNLKVDVKIDGASIFTSGFEAIIVAGAVTGFETDFADPSWPSNSYLEWEILQVGSGNPGADLVVHVVHIAGGGGGSGSGS